MTLPALIPTGELGAGTCDALDMADLRRAEVSAVVACPAQHAPLASAGELLDVGPRNVVQRKAEAVRQHRDLPEDVTQFPGEVGTIDRRLATVVVAYPLLELLGDLA